jgi:hypothetical protein
MDYGLAVEVLLTKDRHGNGVPAGTPAMPHEQNERGARCEER